MKIVVYGFDGNGNALCCSLKVSAVAKDLNLAHGDIRPVCEDRKGAHEFELRRVKHLVHGPETREEIGIFYDSITDAPSFKKIQDLLSSGHAGRRERRDVTTIHD